MKITINPYDTNSIKNAIKQTIREADIIIKKDVLGS